jgi:hypothetical protein
MRESSSWLPTWPITLDEAYNLMVCIVDALSSSGRSVVSVLLGISICLLSI